MILAEQDEYLVVARRKGDIWYVGGIGNSKPRDLSVPLDFIGTGRFNQTLFCDAADSYRNPNHLDKREFVVSSEDVINVHLAPNGGFAAMISK